MDSLPDVARSRLLRDDYSPLWLRELAKIERPYLGDNRSPYYLPSTVKYPDLTFSKLSLFDKHVARGFFDMLPDHAQEWIFREVAYRFAGEEFVAGKDRYFVSMRKAYVFSGLIQEEEAEEDEDFISTSYYDHGCYVKTHVKASWTPSATILAALIVTRTENSWRRAFFLLFLYDFCIV